MKSGLHRVMEAQLGHAVTGVGIPTDITWKVDVSPARKRFKIRFDTKGVLVIGTPPGAEVEQVAAFVRRSLPWIRANAGTVSPGTTRRPPLVKELVPGEGFPILGRSHRLRLVDDGEPVSVQRSGHWLCLRRDQHPNAIGAWYAQMGLEFAQAEAARWADRLGLTQMPDIRIAEAWISKWGDYTENLHQVRLTWPLFQLDPAAVRYVIAHELVHATRPARRGEGSHGRGFQAKFFAVDRDWEERDAQQRKRDLKESYWYGDYRLPNGAEGRLPNGAEGRLTIPRVARQRRR